MRPLIRSSILATLFCVASATCAFAQVTGFLTTPDGKAVAGADVFVNHTSCYSTTDEEGLFRLLDVPPGYHELVAYKAGFTQHRQFMRVSVGQEYNINIQFTVEEKPHKPKSSSSTEEAFRRALLGSDGLLTYLPGTVVVPEGRDGKFRVPSGPVVIEYPSAGYRIIVFFSASNYQDVSEAAYLYQDLPIFNYTRKLEAEKTRQSMFRGSLRHWLRSMAVGKATEEGFQLAEGTDITVAPDTLNSLIRIKCPSSFKLTYAGQVSTITSSKAIDINSNGMLLNTSAISVEGSMARKGLASQLPLDFRPVKDVEAEFAEAMRYFYEKVYIQTDKPYYYPGEALWWKAYVNYYQRGYRDSLSQVLHVELLNSDREVLAYGCYPIENGVTHGDFVVPGYLIKGTYYFRAYTNLQLNFGYEGLFTKAIHVLDAKSHVRPDPKYKSPADAGIVVQPEKDAYKVRDKITLLIKLDSGLTAADLSVSVTDATQVIPLREENLLDTYEIEPEAVPAIKELTYRVERGVSFDGKFLNDKGRGEKTQLTFFQFSSGEVLQIETEDDGSFTQSGLRQPDSTQFLWKADKAKNQPYGKVIVQPRRVPALQTTAGPPMQFVEGGQLTGSETELAKGSRLLNPVQISDTRLSDIPPASSPKARPFGKADYTLNTKQLNIVSGNLLLSLIGKVPGLIVNPTQRMIYFRRAEATTIIGTPLPLVTLNDAPMGGDPYTTLESLDFNTIESVEFHNRINSLYGTYGAYGVIAVYTKSGAVAPGQMDPTLQTITLPGFSRTHNFVSPPTANSVPPGQDFRQTLYWSPEVRTNPKGEATISFFASDVSGMYRVVVEGVSADGWPLRAETFVVVEAGK